MTVFSARRRVHKPLLALSISVALIAGFSAPSNADSKDDIKRERDGVSRKLKDAKSDVHESTKRLQTAHQRLKKAESRLSSAQSKLQSTRGQLVVAQAEDERLRAELAEAETTLSTAEKDVGTAEKTLDTSEGVVATFAVETIMQGDAGLRAFGGLLQGDDPGLFSEQMSATTSISDAQIAMMQDLGASRVLLQVERDKLEVLRNKVADQKAEAERNVQTMQALAAEAEAQETAVSSLVSDRKDAKGEANSALAEDQGVQAALEADRNALSNRLQRIIDEELRKQREEARRKAAAKSGGKKSGGGKKSSGGGSSKPTGDRGGALSRPVGGYVSSSYGMRRHPITGIYKLHDGTDFGASCGTPIRAAASGRVIEQYYNRGYGNRVILNNGVKRGVSVITTYNHLSRFAVRSGARVSRGQVIGYVGTTGYSTGCHLHFMVLSNGRTVNPMGWL